MFFNKKPKLTPTEQKALQAKKAMAEGMINIRDLIAPPSMELSSNYIKIGSTFVRVFFLQEYPRVLRSGWLSKIINCEFALDVSIHISPLPSEDYAKKLRTKSTQIESTLSANAEKGLVRDPKMDATYSDVETLREKLAVGISKMFTVSLYISVYANSLKELDDACNIVGSMIGEAMLVEKPAILQMEQGFNSSLPIAKDELYITRNLDTESVSTFFPFLSATLSTNTGVFYGINKTNNTLVIYDRFSLPNYNSVVLATAGAGKSYAVKLEALRTLMLGAEVIAIDPENEFQRMCERFNGSFLNISINSEQRINPFDLPPARDDDEAMDDLRSNTIMLAGLIKVMTGEMSPQESNILDEAIAETYASRGITEDPATHGLEPPVLLDLQKVLESLNGGQNLAAKLNKYTSGSYAGLLNQSTNISLDNKFITFSIRDLEEELRPIAMYSILNYIWNKVKASRKKRILIVDEAWLLMKYPESAQFLFSMAKRGRKYYLGLTCISQDISDFLSSPYGQPIVHNSSIAMLLKQHPAEVDYVKEAFHLTDAEKTFLLQAPTGDCLFIAGNEHAAIEIYASYFEHQLITTNPEEVNTLEKNI